MRTAHARTPVLCGLLQLAQQVRVVLTRKTRPVEQQVALAEWPMTALARPEVDARSFSEVPAVTYSLRRRRETWKLRYVRGHVRQLLGTRQMMTVREILHALVPALVVAKIRELLEQYAAVLPRDGGYFSVVRAATVRPMAGRAGLVQLGAVREIRLECRALGEFPITRDAWMDGLRGHGSRDHGQRDDK